MHRRGVRWSRTLAGVTCLVVLCTTVPAGASERSAAYKQGYAYGVSQFPDGSWGNGAQDGSFCAQTEPGDLAGSKLAQWVAGCTDALNKLVAEHTPKTQPTTTTTTVGVVRPASGLRRQAHGDLHWFGPQQIVRTSGVTGDPALNTISCPSAALCVAGDNSGDVLWSVNPGAADSQWAIAPVSSDPSREILSSIRGH